jgi:hypothetical protein
LISEAFQCAPPTLEEYLGALSTEVDREGNIANSGRVSRRFVFGRERGIDLKVKFNKTEEMRG